MTVLEGSLEAFALPDIFMLLSRNRMSGALRLMREGSDALVFFQEGLVQDASSNLNRDFIGQRLVDGRLVTQGQLVRILDEQRNYGKGRVGDLLVEKDLVSRSQLDTFMREQVSETIFDVLQWGAGRFQFETGQSSSRDFGLALTVEDLLTDLSRRLEEWEVIRRKIPSPDVIVRTNPSSPKDAGINIQPDEWPLLALADGRKTIREIAAATQRTEFQACRIFYGFLMAGLLDVESQGHSEPAPDRVAPAVELKARKPKRSSASAEPARKPKMPVDPAVTEDLIDRLLAGVQEL